jgi:carbon-monoxide dehydrogenase medium subunit
MKPSSFEYVRAESLDAALAALARFDGEARILAGGQSLMPLMNMRLMRPAALIDVNRVPGLAGIRVGDGRVQIGALTRYFLIENSEEIRTHLPLVAHVIRRIADRQVRNRGTLGGSLCHADPAAQMPLCAVALGASMTVEGPSGQRILPAQEFFQGAYFTAVDPLEMLVEVAYPDCEGTVGTLAQQTRRHGDFPAVSVAASARPGTDGRWSGWGVAMGGLMDRPIFASRIVEALEGEVLDAPLIKRVSTMLEEGIDPLDDVRASAEYRRSLAPIYVERALTTLMQEARA